MIDACTYRVQAININSMNVLQNGKKDYFKVHGLRAR